MADASTTGWIPLSRIALRHSGRVRDAAWAGTGCWLVLAVPFTSFVLHNSYPLLSLELLICGIVLSAVAAFVAVATLLLGWATALLTIPFLILFFLDIHFDLAELSLRTRHVLLAAIAAVVLLRSDSWKIITGAFGIMLLVTAVLPLLPLAADQSQRTAKHGEGGRLWLHLVLDEHIGIEGIPLDIPGGTELRDSLVRAYTENGFRVYGGAYSRYFWTVDSIPNLVNNTTAGRRDSYFDSRRRPLRKNEYFGQLSRDGFRIHVYGSDYVDYCAVAGASLANCRLHAAAGTGWIAILETNAFCKARILSGRFMRLSRISSRASRRVPAMARGIAEWTTRPCGGTVPSRVIRAADGPRGEEVRRILDAVSSVVSEGTGDRAIFAHLMLPHYPYVVNQGCELLPASDWVSGLGTKDDEARRRAYVSYFAQVRCVLQKIEQLLQEVREAGAYLHATVIIHGDHGSRLGTRMPTKANEHDLTDRDFRDAYSTFFAVKKADFEPGYVTEPVALEEIFAQVMSGRPEDGTDVAGREPWVFLHSELETERNAEMTRVRAPFDH